MAETPAPPFVAPEATSSGEIPLGDLERYLAELEREAKQVANKAPAALSRLRAKVEDVIRRKTTLEAARGNVDKAKSAVLADTQIKTAEIDKVRSEIEEMHDELKQKIEELNEKEIEFNTKAQGLYSDMKGFATVVRNRILLPLQTATATPTTAGAYTPSLSSRAAVASGGTIASGGTVASGMRSGARGGSGSWGPGVLVRRSLLKARSPPF